MQAILNVNGFTMTIKQPQGMSDADFMEHMETAYDMSTFGGLVEGSLSYVVEPAGSVWEDQQTAQK